MTSFRSGGWLRTALTLAAAALIALLVVEVRMPESTGSNVMPPAAPVELVDRATVALAPATIQPILSGDGRIVPGEAEDEWMLEATVLPEDQAYRLLSDPVGVRARISGGPSGFDCAWLGLGVAPEGGVTMRCAIPEDIPVVEGLRGTMVLQLDEPLEVQALPSTAVLGQAQTGQVVVVRDDGTSETRTVQLGVADAFNVEIVSGLDPDELVLAAPIQRDFAVGSA